MASSIAIPLGLLFLMLLIIMTIFFTRRVIRKKGIGCNMHVIKKQKVHSNMILVFKPQFCKNRMLHRKFNILCLLKIIVFFFQN